MASISLPTSTADVFRRWRSTTTTGTTTMRKSALPIHHSTIVVSLSPLVDHRILSYCGSPGISGGVGLGLLRDLTLRLLRRQRLGRLRDRRQRASDRIQLPVQDRGAGANQKHIPLDRPDGR